ncbi:MAG: hypothetical protein ACTHJ6_06630, partial [Oryzihumus sp.]
MPVALVIALKDLRQRLRDRAAVILGFVAPLAVAALISLAFGGGDTFHADVAVVDHDTGPVSAGFTSFLTSPELADVVTVRRVASDAAATRMVRDGSVGAAFVLPAG